MGLFSTSFLKLTQFCLVMLLVNSVVRYTVSLNVT